MYKPQRTGAVQFAELLDAVASVDPEMRIRFTSPHPKDFSDDVLRVSSTSLAVLGFPQYVHVRDGWLDYDHVSCTASGVKPSMLAGTGITAVLSAVQGCNGMCSMSCWQVHVSLPRQSLCTIVVAFASYCPDAWSGCIPLIMRCVHHGFPVRPGMYWLTCE